MQVSLILAEYVSTLAHPRLFHVIGGGISSFRHNATVSPIKLWALLWLVPEPETDDGAYRVEVVVLDGDGRQHSKVHECNVTLGERPGPIPIVFQLDVVMSPGRYVFVVLLAGEPAYRLPLRIDPPDSDLPGSSSAKG